MSTQPHDQKTAAPAPKKSPRAEREEAILASWREKDIFGKTLAKPSPKGEFTFYEGPPTANGRPGIHHLEARAFKDAIPRYKTMRGFHVRRKGGWDTHGLPVELQVEKQLGLKSKKEIETYGIAAFNEKCKESVWTYVREWEEFTRRMGYWVDLTDPYITYKPEYIESVWNVIKTVDQKGLMYKDYKVVPWCPRCGTALSSHELAQGYADVKDVSVYVKFKVKQGQKIGNFVTDNKTYILAWTTTPWTLPGNVALAINPDIQYVQIDMDKQAENEQGKYILASDKMIVLEEKAKKRDTTRPFSIDNLIYGKELAGLEYEPLYPFTAQHISEHERPKLKNAYKVYAADFVTTADGTGVVHTAVMYGQDDFELGTKAGLPKHHLVHDDGTFKKETGFLAGMFVKDEATEVAIIKDLAGRGLLFAKEKYQHSYPFCWRCKTPLIYFARDSWYIRMSSLRKELVAQNEGVRWEPEHIKEGRFGEWLREIKDWAISRERYWGTPLPVWTCHSCHARKTVGSIADVTRAPKNRYWVMRHGEAESNVKEIITSDAAAPFHLTDHGRARAKATAEKLKGEGIDFIIASPFVRTQETAQIVRETIGLSMDKLVTDARLSEMGFGAWSGKDLKAFVAKYPQAKRFDVNDDGVETYPLLKKRMGDFLYDLESKYVGKTILIVSHGSPTMMLIAAAMGLDRQQSIDREVTGYIHKAEARHLDFRIVPHNSEYELDLHKPFIDEVKLPCACGAEMHRVKEVMDVWFDSGAMPFAQDHYPFEATRGFLGMKRPQKLAYPADFISEAIDQTRGWFYTLHAVGALMGKGKAFRNVICLGHILDGEGKKMSKSLGNIVNPWDMMDKYGADALRFWMYSVNQPGESKNFEEKTVDEVVKKVFNLAANVASFYKMYAEKEPGVRRQEAGGRSSKDPLDRWIIARLDQLVATITENMDAYVFLEPTRAIRDFVADLSQWYLRRSRDRFKDEGAAKVEALQTTRYVLITLAKTMAPFAPFFAEELYADAGGPLESVHLESWPEAGKPDAQLIADMERVRAIASKGLEARTSAKVNVRQPLASFSTTAEPLPDELASIVADELNVKRVIFKAATDALDLAITPELREEGELRELLRKIQDMRKEKGLTVNDTAVLVATDDLRALVSKNEAEIKKATRLSSIEYGATLALK